MNYDPDESRFTFADTLFDGSWPNGAYRYPAPYEDDPIPLWTPKCEEDEHYITTNN